MKGAQNVAKMAELQGTIAHLKQLVKEHEAVIEEHDLVIKEKRQALESKHEVCEALTVKNRELASENAALKENNRSLKADSESQLQTIAQLQADNAAKEVEICQLKSAPIHLPSNGGDTNPYKKLYETEKAKYEAEISQLKFLMVNMSKMNSPTAPAVENEITKLEAEIDRLKASNLELQTKVANHVQNMDRSNPFLHKFGIYPNIDYNAADLRKYVTMADVVVKSEIDYSNLKEKNAIFKLFLDGELHVTKELEATTLFEHLFYCNLATLELLEQSLSYAEFMKLVSSGTIKNLKFSKVYVENKTGGKALEIDEILKGLSKLEKVEFRLTEYADNLKPSMTPETAKKLGKLERFQFLRKFEIHNLPSNFDRHAFGKFMNKHPNVQFIYSNINANEEVRLNSFEKCKRRIINRLQ